MRRLELHPPPPPPLEGVSFKSLYRKETDAARTADCWVPQITRYRPLPLPQPWDQPILDEPLLLVLELTIGDDVRQSCLAIRDLVRCARARARLHSPVARREPSRALAIDAAGPVHA